MTAVMTGRDRCDAADFTQFGRSAAEGRRVLHRLVLRVDGRHGALNAHESDVCGVCGVRSGALRVVISVATISFYHFFLVGLSCTTTLARLLRDDVRRIRERDVRRDLLVAASRRRAKIKNSNTHSSRGDKRGRN